MYKLNIFLVLINFYILLNHSFTFTVTIEEFIKASFNGDLTIINQYIKEGSNINQRYTYGHTSLMEAVRGRQAIAVQYLLDNKAEVNAQDIFGQNVLHFTLNFNLDKDLDIAKMLLNAPNIQINSQSNNGDTVLHKAALFNNYKLIRLLLSKGAKSDIRNNKGETPLDISKKYRHTESIAALEPSLFNVTVLYIKQNKHKFTNQDFESLPQELRTVIDLAK